MSFVLYDYLSSGNGYKCRLVLKALGMPYQYMPVDILKGETRTPEFLAINPNGKIPVLMVQGRGPIAESHAIPIHFVGVGEKAEDLHPFSADTFARALVGLDD